MVAHATKPDGTAADRADSHEIRCRGRSAFDSHDTRRRIRGTRRHHETTPAVLFDPNPKTRHQIQGDLDIWLGNEFTVDLDDNGPGRAFGKNRRGQQKRGEKLAGHRRSEEHTSELQSLRRRSYAVFSLKKKTKKIPNTTSDTNRHRM